MKFNKNFKNIFGLLQGPNFSNFSPFSPALESLIYGTHRRRMETEAKAKVVTSVWAEAKAKVATSVLGA